MKTFNNSRKVEVENICERKEGRTVAGLESEKSILISRPKRKKEENFDKKLTFSRYFFLQSGGKSDAEEKSRDTSRRPGLRTAGEYRELRSSRKSQFFFSLGKIQFSSYLLNWQMAASERLFG